ncbi:hypothetical protein JX265_004237 [Neoarthrinium moseri]|uniref:Uncharacterized protein n=1 Tax=Neoarthrinium moseri TaxID=1658444 RepID=A0A9P9WQJ8_9PEZI|nr:hypothetical protein JX265_004237 [Neoarthrinium moseri]
MVDIFENEPWLRAHPLKLRTRLVAEERIEYDALTEKYNADCGLESFLRAKDVPKNDDLIYDDAPLFSKAEIAWVFDHPEGLQPQAWIGACVLLPVTWRLAKTRKIRNQMKELDWAETSLKSMLHKYRQKKSKATSCDRETREDMICKNKHRRRLIIDHHDTMIQFERLWYLVKRLNTEMLRAQDLPERLCRRLAGNWDPHKDDFWRLRMLLEREKSAELAKNIPQRRSDLGLWF